MTKEEKKDEMKNRISMALKDPILQQGFEIICKNLVELEKENEELRNNGFTVSAMTEQQLKVAIEKGEQLEKENAEQLAQAKKIIKEMNEGLDKLYLSGLSDKKIAFIERLQDKAEQFLKEIEK